MLAFTAGAMCYNDEMKAEWYEEHQPIQEEAHSSS